MMKKAWMITALLSVCLPLAAFGGSLDSTAAPAGAGSYSLKDVYDRLDTGAAGTQKTFTEPESGAIAPTGRTINEIMGKAPEADDTDGATPADVKAGKTFWGIRSGGGWRELTGTGGDTEDVLATGQTDCYDNFGFSIACAGTGQDGEYRKGVPIDSPSRFTDNGDGTVTDNLTGLIWLKQANYNDVSGATGTATWADADAFCAALSTGECGLTDGSADGDWRLPSVEELWTLIDFGQDHPALPSGHPFTGLTVLSGGAWSSSSCASDPTNTVWAVSLASGHISAWNRSNTFIVWPVRGGN